MKFLRFLKWHWTELESHEKVFTVIFGWLIPCLFASMFVGVIALAICLTGVISGFLGFGFWVAFKVIHARWDKFNKYVDFEHQRVVDKLAGKSVRKNPYTNRKHDYDY